jgi:predicted RNA-binding Zn-ribbon protein involved in translation (DUF1610 family)
MVRAGLRRRLERLEGGDGGPCPECGIDPTLPPEYFVDWEWIVAEPEDRRPAGSSSPPCPRCGRRAVIVVGLDGIIEPEGGGA